MGDYIVSASDDGTLKIWNVQSGTEWRTLSGHANPVSACAISPKRDWIVSVSEDEKLKLWDAHTGECLATLRVDDKLWTCAFYPDGEHIIAGGERGVYFLRLLL